MLSDDSLFNLPLFMNISTTEWIIKKKRQLKNNYFLQTQFLN